AAERGLDTFRRAPARCIAGFALRGALGWLGVLLVALATARLDLASTAGFFAVTILHQLAAFALVFLRAAWLADAIRLTRQTS
ncbi:MAG TPA: hypothetical protein VJT73_03175, partial [Polyangiaceae bacterium]|nr:hypothetical protein [Polyangiaceae bacterium]